MCGEELEMDEGIQYGYGEDQNWDKERPQLKKPESKPVPPASNNHKPDVRDKPSYC